MKKVKNLLLSIASLFLLAGCDFELGDTVEESEAKKFVTKNYEQEYDKITEQYKSCTVTEITKGERSEGETRTSVQNEQNQKGETGTTTTAKVDVEYTNEITENLPYFTWDKTNYFESCVNNAKSSLIDSKDSDLEKEYKTNGMDLTIIYTIDYAKIQSRLNAEKYKASGSIKYVLHLTELGMFKDEKLIVDYKITAITQEDTYKLVKTQSQKSESTTTYVYNIK